MFFTCNRNPSYVSIDADHFKKTVCDKNYEAKKYQLG